MNIMVFDVPAETGGALSILKDFHKMFLNDMKNNYIFVVSKPYLKENVNIKVLYYGWVKKSWLHRLFFDNFVAPNLIRKYSVDEVLSLQNIIIPHSKVFQTVYVHNSLPFADYRFSVLENRLLWVYQNILSIGIFKSIKRANKVIVQTQWMKRACIEKLKVDDQKIEVIPPKLNFKVKKYFEPSKKNLTTFFYPSSGVEFKNHNIIVEACSELQKEGIDNYKVIFTLNGDENKNIVEVYKKSLILNLNIDFIGNISRDKVFEIYSESVLIFPSYIETFGLPLLEAKFHNGIILASDCIFSHEILDGYTNSLFFNPFDYRELVECIKKIIDGKFNYVAYDNKIRNTSL